MTKKTALRIYFFISFVAFHWLVAFFFFCIVLKTASLGNSKSQTADETSPHELSPPFTHSQELAT